MKFDDFKIDGRIKEAIRLKGYTVPSPIQADAIPPALEGRDVLGCAQTGTGKTCAFAVPILNKLAQYPPMLGRTKMRALILTPTRELAMQIDESFKDYGKLLPLKSGLIMGGVGQDKQVKELKAGVDILTATPGRLLDLAAQGHINPSFIEVFVLDEADRMLDMGFLPDVKRIIALLPKQRQTLFFSATMPAEVQKLADTLLINPVKVAVTPVSSTVDRIEQRVCMTDKAAKLDLLVWLMKDSLELTSTLIFTRTKYGADKLSRKLKQAGIKSMAIHGDKSQGARQTALREFKKGGCKVLVATDIAARGLDIDGISHVINFELPNEPETYVHRIGRTGRAGRDGIAVSLCDFDEKPYLADIEKLIKKKIPVFEEQPYPMTVFVKTIKQQKLPRTHKR